MLALSASADEVNVVYGTFTTTSGKSMEVRLYDDGVTVFPKLNISSRTFTINGKAYALSDIESLRFDVRKEEVSAISDVKAEENVADNNVYTLGGTLVRKGDGSLEGLPKGVYILNKKKIVVK